MILRLPLTPAALAVSACLGLSLAAAQAQDKPAAIPRPEPASEAARAAWPEARLKFDGSWEYTHERRDNFDLDKSRARDRRTDEHEIKLGVGAAVSPVLAWYLQAVGLAEDRHTEGSGRDRSSTLDRGEMWLQWRPSAESNGFLQAGRLPWVERRSWWWDEDLDGLRWTHQFGDLAVQTGVAQEWGRASSAWSGIDPVQRGVLRWFGQVGWTYAPRHSVEAFWLKARDRSGVQTGRLANEDETDPSDFSGHWLGLRASGEWRGESGQRLSYWADAAAVRGRDRLTAFDEDANGRFTAGSTESARVKGHAFDLGGVWSGGSAWRPSLTLAYAKGSGGVSDGQRDDNFRQTGLQENRQRLGGIKRVRRYGELLRPELSNLEVMTVGAGVRLTPTSSVELLGHQYRQATPATEWRGARLSADPGGTNAALGREFDLVYAWRPSGQVELVLSGSRFLPGAAFSAQEQDAATGLGLGLTLSF